MTLVTLSQSGVTLILLENELANNQIAIRRWSRRLTEAETELQELTKQRHMLTEALNRVKDSI